LKALTISELKIFNLAEKPLGS